MEVAVVGVENEEGLPECQLLDRYDSLVVNKVDREEVEDHDQDRREGAGREDEPPAPAQGKARRPRRTSA